MSLYMSQTSLSADLGDHNGLSMTWKQVNIPAGTKVLVSLEDGNEDDGWSQEVRLLHRNLIA
jgi:hypothetical protein